MQDDHRNDNDFDATSSDLSWDLSPEQYALTEDPQDDDNLYHALYPRQLFQAPEDASHNIYSESVYTRSSSWPMRTRKFAVSDQPLSRSNAFRRKDILNEARISTPQADQTATETLTEAMNDMSQHIINMIDHPDPEHLCSQAIVDNASAPSHHNPQPRIPLPEDPASVHLHEVNDLSKALLHIDQQSTEILPFAIHTETDNLPPLRRPNRNIKQPADYKKFHSRGTFQ